MLEKVGTLFPYLVMFITLVTLISFCYVFIAANRISDTRVWLALGLVSTFIYCCVCTITVFVGLAAGTWSFKDDSLIKWMGGLTVAEIAGMVTLVLTFFFPGHTPGPLETKKG
jgi:hypothetical protein